MKTSDLLALQLAKTIYAAKKVELDKNKLTETEQKIFDLLLSVVNDYKLGTTLRVAGGWVRDKLMGKDSKDIDLALDNLSGQKFANLVVKWMAEHGMDPKGVGIIEANPDQSKHLETATTFIFDLPIDFVNLRTETYANNSRIPTVAIGTPEEDAFRRDLTINALFYNLNTGEIEDFTGKGLDDLENGIIRTPLDPKVTFKEDPLRIPRAIRFAARYGFKLDDDLKAAAMDPEIREALDKNISRERIGAELKGMLKGPNPSEALALINELGLRDIIFKKPDGMAEWDMDQRTPHHEMLLWDHLVKVVGTLNNVLKSKDINADDRIILLLAAFLHDVGKLDPAIHGEKELEGKMVASYHGHEESSKKIAEHLLHDLKMSNKEVEDVVALIGPAGQAENMVRERLKGNSSTRKALGKFVRGIGDKWRHAVWLAMADEASKKRDGVEHDRFGPYEDLISNIEGLNMDKAHEIKPLVNGNELQKLLNIKPGPQIGQIMSALIDWQLSTPDATKEGAIQWLSENYNTVKKAEVFPLSLVKMANQHPVFDKGYLFLPVSKPEADIPDGLKNRGEYHITIIEPPEVKAMVNNLKATQGLSGKEAEVTIKQLLANISINGEPVNIGVGKQTAVDNEVYFMVVKWPEAQEFRASHGLPEKHFHITLGFTSKDIHGVSKDESTLV